MHVLPQAGEPPTLTEGKIQEAVGPQLFLRGRKKLREQDVSVISLIDSTLTGSCGEKTWNFNNEDECKKTSTKALS
jgi:hypothetical protein